MQETESPLETSMTKRLVHTLAVLVGLLPLAAGAQTSDNYPSRTIKLVLPYSPGGPTDAIARAVAKNMETALGVPVIVENKAGGQGVIAMQSVLLSKPDGYTVGWAPSSGRRSKPTRPPSATR